MNKYIFKKTLINIRRSSWRAYTLVLVMFFTFVVFELLLVLMFSTNKLVKYFVEKPEIVGFFKDGVDEKDIISLKNTLEQKEFVSEVKYVSKEEAMANFLKSDPENKKIIEAVQANVLPAHLNIKAKNLDSIENVKNLLGEHDIIEDIKYSDSDIINTLKRIILGIEIFGGILLLIFTSSAITILFLIIGLTIYSQKDEISILSLVGASEWYIKAPYLIQGILYMITSVILSNIVIIPLLVIYYDDFVYSLTGHNIDAGIGYMYVAIAILMQFVFGFMLVLTCTQIATKRYLKY